MSTLVRTPSGCMPAKRARPDTPDPVPTSTTAFAEIARASRVSVLAPPRPIGATPRWDASSRAAAAASDSSRKSSAKAQLAGLGADLAEVFPAVALTRASLAIGSRASVLAQRGPYDDHMSHTVVADLVVPVLRWRSRLA